MRKILKKFFVFDWIGRIEELIHISALQIIFWERIKMYTKVLVK